MDELTPTQIERREFPDDFVELSLHRYAGWVNREDGIPVVFGEDSLRYLFELGYTLPRQGFLFVTIAREFVLRFETVNMNCEK